MVKPIAFYLPQYHPIPENDEWWGKGFTEWTNVVKAKPNFDGHYQPHEPAELGYYDLREVDVQRRQAALAKEYGLHGFCFYYYWFNGRRVLERPLNQFVEHTDIDLNYCVCWANENWTRTWDGKEKDVLLGQKHSPEDDTAFLRSLLPMFADKRYIKVDGKPMLLVYRVDLFPDMKATAARWRKIATEAGFPGLHLCAVQFYGISDPRPWGFDAAVEFPPHQLIGPENKPDVIPSFTNPNFKGAVLDYQKVMAQALARPDVEYERYRGIMPSWDNTARRQDTPHMFINSSQHEYEFWLKQLVVQTRVVLPADRQYIFINAWNEWGEGCHLEPDLRYGRQWLEATNSALNVRELGASLIERARQAGPNSTVWKELEGAFAARERSLIAMQDLIRRKNEFINQLHHEVAIRSKPKGSKELLREVLKKEVNQRFPTLGSAWARLRS